MMWRVVPLKYTSDEKKPVEGETFLVKFFKLFRTGAPWAQDLVFTKSYATKWAKVEKNQATHNKFFWILIIRSGYNIQSGMCVVLPIDW